MSISVEPASEANAHSQSHDCSTRSNPGPAHIQFVVEPVPPFRLDLTAWVLRRRPANVVDRWDGAPTGGP